MWRTCELNSCVCIHSAACVFSAVVFCTHVFSVSTTDWPPPSEGIWCRTKKSYAKNSALIGNVIKTFKTVCLLYDNELTCYLHFCLKLCCVSLMSKTQVEYEMFTIDMATFAERSFKVQREKRGCKQICHVSPTSKRGMLKQRPCSLF